MILSLRHFSGRLQDLAILLDLICDLHVSLRRAERLDDRCRVVHVAARPESELDLLMNHIALPNNNDMLVDHASLVLTVV